MDIAQRCEEMFDIFGPEEYAESPEILYPPKYILMWDVIGSTTIDNRVESLERDLFCQLITKYLMFLRIG